MLYALSPQGDSVHSLTGALIPVEPMYLVMNTAISHRWGMPEPCPKDECGACWLCYDCTNPECQCTLPEGMQGCKNLPAEMKVDFIRLYQDTDDPSHTVGCSPDQYPTEDYIKVSCFYKFINNRDVPVPTYLPTFFNL